MAYSTGSATNLNGLLDALRVFALAQGWTINKWTSGSNLLFMSKGITAVAMQGLTKTYNDYATGSLVVKNDDYLAMALSSSITTALTTFYGHPGSYVPTSSTSGLLLAVNDLTGPFPSYHLFADNTVSNHIHVVVQTATDRWQHFSIGEVDKGTLTHGGVSYAQGNSRYYYRDTTAIVSSGTLYYNDMGRMPYPFALNGDRVSPITSADVHVYAPDALPNNQTNWPLMSAATFEHTKLYGLNYASQFPRGAAYEGRLLAGIMINPVSQWGGNVLLWAIPVIRKSSVVGQSCYVGDYPNVRALNMEGMIAGQEIVLSTETWKVFPIGRQTAWGTQTQVGFNFTSGQYALAYKKV